MFDNEASLQKSKYDDEKNNESCSRLRYCHNNVIILIVFKLINVAFVRSGSEIIMTAFHADRTISYILFRI